MLEMVHDRTATGCCTAMWKANGKTTALLLFLASPFPKTRGYWKLKEEALDSTRFGRCSGSVARQTAE